MRWVIGGVVAVVLISVYLTWTAARVERLQLRVVAATRALEAHLLRRAAAAAVLDDERYPFEVYAAARIALDASDEDREVAENDLTRQLRATTLPDEDPQAQAVIVASRRLAVARQVHTDLVRDALAVRRRPIVRLLRMGRRHQLPAYFDIDDPTINAPTDLPVS
ncbi:hypothetical protein [Polymorphospora rubra]|uniref:NUDIX hydrolase n=1 Tax=Polymorphospora rubra TaxID=338584 RepID=A0A810N5M4_9ACTN|nr:hypothetical protein [Polymorphospora rubra]BCJ67824.1 hypothetical protein Prubr_48450 [Polymorphospora rubra]